MNNLTLTAKYLKDCLYAHKTRTGEGQQSLASQLGCSQGAISQANRQTETNGNMSLGVQTASRLFNIIGGDLYSYMPELEPPRSGKNKKNNQGAFVYVMAIYSPHPKVEQRVLIADMHKIGHTQDLESRACQLDATHPEYRHKLIAAFWCKNLTVAQGIEISLLDKYKQVRNSEYICTSEAEIIAQINKAASIWSNDRVQKLTFCT